jgi:hypothetical protein
LDALLSLLAAHRSFESWVYDSADFKFNKHTPIAPMMPAMIAEMMFSSILLHLAILLRTKPDLVKRFKEHHGYEILMDVYTFKRPQPLNMDEAFDLGMLIINEGLNYDPTLGPYFIDLGLFEVAETNYNADADRSHAFNIDTVYAELVSKLPAKPGCNRPGCGKVGKLMVNTNNIHY